MELISEIISDHSEDVENKQTLNRDVIYDRVLEIERTDLLVNLVKIHKKPLNRFTFSCSITKSFCKKVGKCYF